MASVTYNLRNPNSKKETPIILIYRYDRNKIKYSTDEIIHPKNWNPETQRARASMTDCVTLNKLLDKLEAEFKNSHRNLFAANQNVTPDAIKNLVDESLERKPKERKEFWEFYEFFIETVTAIKKESTISTYKQTKTVLKDFEKFKNKKIVFSNITIDLYNELIAYMTTEKRFCLNTIGKHIKILKTILSEATERGINKKIDFKNKKFKVFSEETDSIYLTESDLSILFKTNLTKTESLERARDLFLVGCWTGLRFSDFTRLQKVNKDDENVKIKDLKNGKNIVVPIHPILKKIIIKYNYNWPPSISNQPFNRYLKDIGKIAKLEDNITLSRSKSGKQEQTNFKKFQLITTHTARRSFATNLYLSGYPSIGIMAITGHKTEKAFMRYIKVAPEQHAKKLKEFWERKKLI